MNFGAPCGTHGAANALGLSEVRIWIIWDIINIYILIWDIIGIIGIIKDVIWDII